MKKGILFVIFIMFVLNFSLVSAELVDSSWPTFQGNLQRTGFSDIDTSHVDGTVLWKFQTGEGIESSPTIDDKGNIYFGSHDGYLYSITKSGELRWKTKVADQVMKGDYGHLIGTASSPAIDSDGNVYLISMDQYLFSINKEGEINWRFPISVRFDSWSSPAIDEDGTIYIISNNPDAAVYAVNSDGTEKWKFRVGTNAFNSVAIGKDGTIYAGVPSGYSGDELVAFNSDGSVKWRTNTQFIESTPSIGEDGTIYAGTFVDGNVSAGVYAFDSGGNEKWFFDAESKEVMTTPAIDENNNIYFASVEGTLFSVDSSGNERWRFRMDGESSSSVVIGKEGSIYFGSGDGNFYSFDLDGNLRWKVDGGSFASSPAIAEDGTVYTGCWDGNLYAFGGSEDIREPSVEDLSQYAFNYSEEVVNFSETNHSENIVEPEEKPLLLRILLKIFPFLGK